MIVPCAASGQQSVKPHHRVPRARDTTDELRRGDHRGVNLISDALPFGRLWYGEPDAISKSNRLGQVFQPLT
jgi:hypothetical protein